MKPPSTYLLNLVDIRYLLMLTNAIVQKPALQDKLVITGRI